MRVTYNLLEVTVGAIVVSIALYFGLAVYGASNSGKIKDCYPISALFSRAGGIVENNEVRVAGVKVGHVTGVRLDPERYNAIVDLCIAKHITLPRDSYAKIGSDGLISPKFIELEPGSEHERLKSGEVITYTQSELNIMNLVNKFLNKPAG